MNTLPQDKNYVYKRARRATTLLIVIIILLRVPISSIFTGNLLCVLASLSFIGCKQDFVSKHAVSG